MASFHETQIGSQWLNTILSNSRRLVDALERIATNLATIADELKKAREDKKN